MVDFADFFTERAKISIFRAVTYNFVEIVQ